MNLLFLLYSAEGAPLAVQAEFLEVNKKVNYKDQESVDAFKSAWGTNGLVAQDAVETCSYSRAVINKEGEAIDFYVTHLSVESVDVRKKQFQQLKKVLDSDTTTYKILVGDIRTMKSTNIIFLKKAINWQMGIKVFGWKRWRKKILYEKL